MLRDGDQTEIGERGLTLSGGQKQRISLARALYSDKAMYLLDDPLSAVDAEVGRRIFKRAIRGMLRGKTVLFVTHQLQFLPQCDRVLLIERARVAEAGSHAELMARAGSYAKLVAVHHANQRNIAEGASAAAPNAAQGMISTESSSHCMRPGYLSLILCCFVPHRSRCRQQSCRGEWR